MNKKEITEELSRVVNMIENQEHYLVNSVEARLKAIEDKLNVSESPSLSKTFLAGIHNAVLSAPEHILMIIISVYLWNNWGVEALEYLNSLFGGFWSP